MSGSYENRSGRCVISKKGGRPEEQAAWAGRWAARLYESETIASWAGPRGVSSTRILSYNTKYPFREMCRPPKRQVRTRERAAATNGSRLDRSAGRRMQNPDLRQWSATRAIVSFVHLVHWIFPPPHLHFNRKRQYHEAPEVCLEVYALPRSLSPSLFVIFPS